MADAPAVFTIPPHRAFADALASGLIAAGGDLYRTLLLLPNRRAQRALTEAFVRQSGGALLLPRMLPVGDVGEDEALGLFDDLIEYETSVAPAIDALERRMLLMRLVQRWQSKDKRSIAAVETLRLADALARTLDQLQLEGVNPRALDEAGADLGEHWTMTRDFLRIIVEHWPKLLAERGCTDRVARRQQLLGAIVRRWQATPPQQRIVAAGISNADPAVAQLLAVIARLPDGMVVLPGLDLDTPDWDDLGKFPTHPQASLRQLLDRMDVARAEVREWPHGSERDGPRGREAALAEAMALPASTARWAKAAAVEGLATVEAANPAEEALVIALAMRRQLETPAATAALVTPDRDLARRVAAQLARWQVVVDDSAGTPLSRTPPGTLVIAAVEAAAARFAPTALLTLLKHPLAGPEGETARLQWLDKVRALDLALRGTRPSPGLAGVARRIGADKALAAWWKGLRPVLDPLEKLMKKPAPLDVAAETLRAFVGDFAGERAWRGAAGKAAGELVASLIAGGGTAPPVPPGDLSAFIAELVDGIAVRPPFGSHPRLAIYGLLEARLQRADLMILGGLNEGVWPGADRFDPWLPPSVRRQLGMPETERATGLSAHDFVMAAGAPQVLLTRAARDTSAPAVPSRFWLRLHAYARGELTKDETLLAAARAIELRDEVARAPRPAPEPPVAARPKRISVTQVDRLRADPFSFYAEHVLGLPVLDPLDADPTAADKGTLVHKMLEGLIVGSDIGNPDARASAIEKAMAQFADHPLLDALWRPRVERMLDWVADTMSARQQAGWQWTWSERKGSLSIDGVELVGKADVIQRSAHGLAIADFKTGRLPSGTQVADRFATQLGLLAALAQRGLIDGVDGAEVAELAYWKLSGGAKTPGEEKSTARHFKNAWGDVPAFIDACFAAFETAVREYLNGTRAFEAKLFAEYAQHLHDYDHLARVDEWQGRR